MAAEQENTQLTSGRKMYNEIYAISYFVEI